jgi:thioester reductase-like protein
VNIEGTRSVLRFCARDATRPVPLVHVSTAYVCGERTGLVREDDLDAGQTFGTHYERSKFLAEQEVRAAAADGLPTAVVRPSLVVGTERTGAVRDFKNMYVVLKLFTQGRVRSVPGFYDAVLDLVPVDHAATVICRAADRFEQAEGRTLHAVGAGPHSLLEFSNVLAEYPSFQVPRFVTPSSFSVERLPFGERVYYERIVSRYESFFRRRARFDDTATAALVGRRPSLRGASYLRKLLDHCLRVGYLGTVDEGIDEVLAGLSS